MKIEQGTTYENYIQGRDATKTFIKVDATKKIYSMCEDSWGHVQDVYNNLVMPPGEYQEIETISYQTESLQYSELFKLPKLLEKNGFKRVSCKKYYD